MLKKRLYHVQTILDNIHLCFFSHSDNFKLLYGWDVTRDKEIDSLVASSTYIILWVVRDASYRINTLSRDYTDPGKLAYLILDLCGTRRPFNVCPIVVVIDFNRGLCAWNGPDRESAVDAERVDSLDKNKKVGKHNRKVRMLFSERWARPRKKEEEKGQYFFGAYIMERYVE